MTNETIRPPVRDHVDVNKIRPRDTRLEAQEYAREIIDAGSEDIGTYDDFYINKDIQPDGWNYEWRRTSVAGKEDAFYQADLARKGWRPVPAARHPELMPLGWKGANIEKKGQILMEWPTILVERAKRRENKDARDAVDTAEQRLYATPAGSLSRDDYNELVPPNKRGVKKTFESGAA
jgi:hypothetical protein